MAYPTASECKAFSDNIPEVVNASTESLNARISEAIELIHNKCGQKFDENEVNTTKYFNGNDSNVLTLYPRCYKLISVYNDGYNLTDIVNLKYGNNFSKLEAIYDVYDLGPRYRVSNIMKEYGKVFLAGSNNIKVTGDWGWSAIPETIKLVCMMIVEKLMIKRLDIRQWATPFETERTPDGYSYTKGSFIKMIFDDEVYNLLYPYIYDLVGVYKI